MRLAEITSQNIANKLFDMGVNMGVHQAVHLAQRALNALISTGAQPLPAGEPLLEDGIVGDHTIAAINAADPIHLHAMIVEVCKTFYIHIVSNNPAQALYLHGWLKRAES